MVPALVAFCLVLAVSALLVIYWPFFERRTKGSPQSTLVRELDRLYYERERLMQNLEDLEHDRELKKIGEQDYKILRAKLLGETAHIYDLLKHVEESNPILIAIEKDLGKIEKELH